MLAWIYLLWLFINKRIMSGKEEHHEPLNPEYVQNHLFDCPFCLLPAEVIALIVQSDGVETEFKYLAECLGDHYPFKVDPLWLEEELTKAQ